MEPEIKQELTANPERAAELEDQLKVKKCPVDGPPRTRVELQNYKDVKKDHIGDTIEEINEKSKIDRALFQGDMLLTRSVPSRFSAHTLSSNLYLLFPFREQADEVIEDIKDNEMKRNRRQAYRDNRYPNTLWSNGVYYTFHWNACQHSYILVQKVFNAKHDYFHS